MEDDMTRMGAAILVAILIMVGPVSPRERTRNHRYRVVADWWIPNPGYGSGLNIIDEFSVPESEDAEPRTIKLLDTGYTVTVAVIHVRQHYKSGGRPIQVWMAIEVGTRTSHDIFRSPESAEARMPYHHVMRGESVSKRIQIDGRIWTIAI